MKYLKFTLFMFVVCLIMSYTNTQAREVLGVSGFEVKAYGLETSLGEYRTKKEDFTTHTYENVGTVKLYGSGEYTNIMVKVCNKAGKCTKYKEFSTNKKLTYSEDAIVLKGQYTLKFKNPKFTAYRLSHSGVWTY